MLLHTERSALVISVDNRPDSIAVLQLGRIGDMILTTPLFAALHELYPDAHITVIAMEGSGDIPESDPAVHKVVTIPLGFFRLPKLATEFFTQRFDLYIDPKDHKSSTSRLLAKAVRADRVLVETTNHPNTGNAIAFRPPPPSAHFVDRMLAPLQQLAPGKVFPRRPRITIPTDSIRRIEHQLPRGNSGMVTINISAGHNSRHWEPESWHTLIESLPAGLGIAIISAPAHASIADSIATPYPNATAVRTVSILDAAAVLAASSLLISPDTSIIHIASALNLPTIGLYPHITWNADVFSPLANKHVVLMAPEGGTVRNIESGAVIEAAHSMLGV